MKKFIQIYLICFICLAIFFFFGGFMLFDMSRNVYLPAAAISFIIAILIHIFIAQGDKIEELEKRIKNLEENKQ